MRHKKFLMILAVLVLMMAACLGSGDTAADTQQDNETQAEEVEVVEEENGEDTENEEAEVESDQGDSIFPLPHEYEVLTMDDTSVNFQTSASLDDMIDFYRNEFDNMGLTERELLTTIEDGVVSMVFDGHESGMAVVLQMVDLGDSINVNIRLEDV